MAVLQRFRPGGQGAGQQAQGQCQGKQSFHPMSSFGRDAFRPFPIQTNPARGIFHLHEKEPQKRGSPRYSCDSSPQPWQCSQPQPHAPSTAWWMVMATYLSNTC